MRAFEYIAPQTIVEAVAALQQHDDAAVLAGGTDILLRMRANGPAPQALVDIKRIRGFGELKIGTRKGLTIGPAVTMGQLAASAEIRDRYPALNQGAGLVASVQIRNRATVAGNLCNAAPSADTAPPLLALGARVRISGPRGRRSLLLSNFFTGPGQTALEPGELVTALHVPPVAKTAAKRMSRTTAKRSGSAYTRHTPREAMDIAAVGVAVALTLGRDGTTCEEVAIALGAVAPTPLRARQAEKVLRGHALDEERVADAAECAAGEARPISDVRASAAFRRDLVRVLTGRMVRAAATNARERASAGRRTP